MSIVLSVFVVVVLLQLMYYILFTTPFLKKKKNNLDSKNVPISVIVCAKNEAENLRKFLPSIINQNYSNFELVLINDASYDTTLEVMEHFKKNYPLLIKIVNVKNNEAFWGNKKYALTLGIKAAKYEHLLFTDADCKPLSKNWIVSMSSYFSDTKSIVLGYGAYEKNKSSLLNKLIRFETLQTAMQYFSYAHAGMPYMGVGRNLAYKKSEFFKVNGFIKHIQLRSGDDDLFVNEAATSANTTFCLESNGHTVSIAKKTFKEWIKQKRRHITTAKYYKTTHKIVLFLFYLSQILFWVLAPFLLLSNAFFPTTLGFISLKLIFQLISTFIAAKKLNEKDLIIIAPFLEFCLISIQFYIFIKNIFSKPTTWN